MKPTFYLVCGLALFGLSLSSANAGTFATADVLSSDLAADAWAAQASGPSADILLAGCGYGYGGAPYYAPPRRAYYGGGGGFYGRGHVPRQAFYGGYGGGYGYGRGGFGPSYGRGGFGLYIGF